MRERDRWVLDTNVLISLDAALCGQAHGLITGDQDLLVLHPFHGLAIQSPAQFLSA